MNSLSWHRRTVIVAGLAIILVILTRILLIVPRRSPAPALPDLTDIPTPDDLYVTSAIALSPSGDAVALAGTKGNDRQILIVEIATGRVRHKISVSHVASPFWLNDGITIAYGSSGALLCTNTHTGATRTLCRINPTGGDCNSTGTVVFAAADGRIYRIGAAGGTPQALTEPDAGNGSTHRWPHFLPDQERYLFTVDSPAGRQFAVQHLGTSAIQFIGSGHGNEVFVNIPRVGDYLVFASNDRLLVQPYDLVRLQPAGPPRLLYERPGFDETARVPVFSVNGAGDIIVCPRDRTRSRLLAWVDRCGQVKGILEPGRYANPRLSPDGTKVIIDWADMTGRTNLWLIDINTGTRRQLTHERIRASNAVWSPDGTRFAYYCYRGPNERQVNIRRVYSERDESQLTPEIACVPTDWLPDASTVVADVNEPAKPTWIATVPADEPRITPKALLHSDTAARFAASFSPSGKLLAYTAEVDNVVSVYAARADEISKGVCISPKGGSEPRWSRNSGELYFVSREGNLMAAQIDGSTASVRGAPEVVTRLRWPDLQLEYRSGLGYWPSPDGTQFLFNLQTMTTGRRLVLMKNWSR